MNGRRQASILAICVVVLAAFGCASTRVTPDKIGEPLVAAVKTSEQLASTATVISNVIAALPESPEKNQLTAESSKLTEQITTLTTQLDAVVSGYWKMISERSKEQTKLSETKLLAAKRLTWALAASIALIAAVAFIFRRFIPI